MNVSQSRAAKLLIIIIGALLLPLGLVVILYLAQDPLIYHPFRYQTNYRHLLPKNAVELDFRTDGLLQSAFYLPARNGSKLPERIWVAFSGNGAVALGWLPFVEDDPRPGDAFLLVDYPGYGLSEGKPSIATTRSAAQGALTVLAAHPEVNEKDLEPRLNAIGHSLGAGAALDFAIRHPVRNIILLAPFTSLRGEAARYVGDWLSHLRKDNYDNRAALRLVSQRHPPPRVVIFHGADDTMIPAAMGRELANEFPLITTFHLVPEADHDDIALKARAAILAALAE